MKAVKIMVTGLLMCMICIFCLILAVSKTGGTFTLLIGFYGFFISVIVTLVGIFTESN